MNMERKFHSIRSYTLDKLKGPISLEDSADAKRGAEELGEAEDDESA